MASAFNFTKLRRFIKIYAAVQVFLIALLIYMAVFFQAGLRAEGRPQRFFHSVVVTLVIQLALFYPINRFAVREAEREVEACAEGLGFEKLKALRSSRTIGDVIKAGVFLFFITFSYRAPQDKFVLSVIFFSFILTFLSYFQCFNFAAKRSIAGKS
jgi:hypothetical protein